MSETIQCPNPGAFRYTWPGENEAQICVDCVRKLLGVATAIGLHLQIIAVPEEQQWQCQQFITIERTPDASLSPVRHDQ